MVINNKWLRLSIGSVGAGLLGAVMVATTLTMTETPANASPIQRVTSGGVHSPGDQTSSLTQTVSARINTMLNPVIARTRVQSLSMPLSTTLAAVSVSTHAVTVVLDIPEAALYDATDVIDSDEINRAVINSLDGLAFTTFYVLANDPRDPQAGPKPLHLFIPTRPMEYKPFTTPVTVTGATTSARATQALAASSYALTGKSVYVSAGHGWYWHPSLGWTTQRGVWNGLIEDFNNAEAVNQYLIAYLRQAGADVFPVRDHTMLVTELRIDNSSSGYSESGSWTTSCPTSPYTPGYGDGCLRYTSTVVASTPTASASWSAVITTSGDYPVYAWYNAGTDRPAQAHYQILYAGGTGDVVIDQQVHGYTWRYLGTFYFRAGETARVTLINTSNVAGATLIADAIRLGGGVGDVDRGGGASQKPRFEEAARYWAMLQGASASVYDPVTTGNDADDDVTARPRYADWENVGTGDDAIYVSWHTNGASGNARGTESYVYNNDPTPPYDQYTRVDGSLELQAAVHDQVIQAIRAGWDASWSDRGKLQANLGEVRVAQSMPSMLIEMAFHDNITDAAQLREPRFEQLLARAVYQGIVKYYAQQDGTTASFLPEVPERFVMRNIGSGQVLLSWQAPSTFAFGTSTDAAQRYRVYLSSDGFAWDQGQEVTSTSLTLGGFSANQVVYARVTAVNTGGESFPTPVLAVRIGTAPRVLLVHGFDSLNGAMRVVQSGATRMFLDRMNRYNYIVQHATSVIEPFDSAVHQAVNAGTVVLAGYKLVDWYAGGQSMADGVLSTNERQAMRNFVSASHRVLLLSGAHVATSLASSDTDFLNNVLKTVLVGTTSNSSVSAASGALFTGVPAFTIDDGTGTTYDARGSDTVAPTSGGVTVLRYGDGTTSAISSSQSSGASVVYLSFPFETVASSSTRISLMARVLSLLPSQPFTPTHWLFLPRVVNAAQTCGQLIANDGFEESATWQINSTPYPAAYTTAQAHNGSRSMQTGIPLDQTSAVQAYSSISQTVALPGITPLTLTVWRYSLTQDADDQFYISLWGRGDLDRVTTASSQWQQLAFDLSPYAGQTISLMLGTYNDGDALKSAAYYDDVSITCGQ